MDKERVQDFIARARHWCAFIGARRLVSAATSLVAFAVVMWFVFRPSVAPVEDLIPMETVPASSTSERPVRVTVHVAGEVATPGVYSLSAGSRVVDAIDAAGGATREADLVRINLAQVLNDTEQVFIPSRRATSRAPTATVAPRHQPTTTVASPSAGGAVGSSGPVNLNTATEAELEALPGIGPATAKAIVVHRRDKGPFARVDDLLNVPGIGPSKLAALEGLVTTG